MESSGEVEGVSGGGEGLDLQDGGTNNPPLLRMVCLVCELSLHAGTISLRSSNRLFRIFLLLCSESLWVVRRWFIWERGHC